MKLKIIILAALLCFLVLADAAEQAFSDSMSIVEISAVTYVPVLKLVEYLGLERTADTHIPLRDLGCTDEDLQKAIQTYKDNRLSFYIGIMVVGMVTVFLGLVLVSIFLSQLPHLDKKKKTPPVKLPESSFSDMEISETDAITAAITATIYLHELEVEENNKLLLTWKRNTLSMWKVAGYIPMNETDPLGRK